MIYAFENDLASTEHLSKYIKLANQHTNMFWVIKYLILIVNLSQLKQTTLTLSTHTTLFAPELI